MKKELMFSELLVFAAGAGILLTACIFPESFLPQSNSDTNLMSVPALESCDRIYGVELVGTNIVWLAGNWGKIVRSDDSGRSWKLQETGVIEHLQDIAAWDEKRAVAVGNEGVVIVTRDEGTTWRQVEAPLNEVANKLIKIKTYPGGRAWASGIMGTILFTDNWGDSWKRCFQDEDVALNDITFVDDDTGLVVGEFGRIMMTTNGGKGWEKLESPIRSSLMAVSFRDREHGVAVGLDGIILRTLDGGRSWLKVTDSGTKEHIFGLTWDGQRWICVGAGGVLVTGDVEGEIWKAQRLSEHDLSWHTDVACGLTKLFIVGESQGIWDNGKWVTLT